MSMTARKLGDDRFAVLLAGNEVILDAQAFRDLINHMLNLLEPGSDEETSAFLLQLSNGHDVGVQALLRVADHDDIVALLKAAQSEPRALGKLGANMSENARKLFDEDLNFRFAKGASSADLNAAIHRLIAAVRDIEKNGTPVFN